MRNVPLGDKERFCNAIAPQFEAISDSRQRKFSQPVNLNIHGRKSWPKSGRTNYRLVQERGVF